MQRSHLELTYSGPRLFATPSLVCWLVLQVLSSQVRPVLHSPISVLLTRLTQLQPAYLVVLLSAGGIATAPGVLLGAVIIGCIYNGMNFLNIGSYYQYMTKGIIIILAVLLDMVINKKNR